ncbi:MAG: NfeD family protein [Eubacteriales bacterium]|nr:NfeD family protein [Eubacteriales bacterium]
MQNIWLLICAISFIIELFSLAMVSIWFVFGSIAAYIAYFFHLNFYIQIIIFFIISFISFFICKIFWKNKIKNHFIPTNADRYIGKVALVIDTIDNLHSTGTIKINGQIWNARNVNENEILNKDEKVIIKEIQGSKMLIEKYKGETE